MLKAVRTSFWDQSARRSGKPPMLWISSETHMLISNPNDLASKINCFPSGPDFPYACGQMAATPPNSLIHPLFLPQLYPRII
jgi:hypothetical protein